MKLKPLALLSLSLPFMANAQTNPVEQALKKEGAQVNLPVEAGTQAFTPEFVESARDSLDNFHWQMGGDHALYYNANMNEFLTTAIASPNAEYKPLERAITPELDALKVETSKGELTMQEYLADPQFRTRGFMLIHQGKVVYEAYPGMNPTDRHIWASSAKTTVGLIVAQLAEEGKVDTTKPIVHYIPELKGTVWDKIAIMDLLNHTTGLDNEEKLESILDPDSSVVRLFASSFGSARQATGEVETWMNVAKDTQALENESAGEHFRYASMNTLLLTKMIENIEQKTWSQVFEERVWGKMTARQPALFNQTPDGTALALGLMLTTLEDMGRFGTLWTPSWQVSAVEPVVTPEVINRIYTSGNPDSYIGSQKEASSVGAFNDKASFQSYQFDFIYDDGAMAKSGNLGQMIYIDPARDFVGVMFSTNPYHSGYGENKGPALMRSAAKLLADES